MLASLHVISKEIIKPSSQTPTHLRKLKLSYLDQLAPPSYVPMIFFYQADELRGLNTTNHLQISQKLKQSLSNTLTLFYPLAGRIQDRSVVDCNDAGAEFIEARARTQLNDALQEPINEQLKHLTADSSAGAFPGAALVTVKVTFFDCGGIAIGVCVSHKTWNFLTLMRKLTSNEKNIVTKRFVFDKEKLEALKQAATSPSGSNVKNPTRVEVVSAFIWKHFIDVAKSENPEAKKTFIASHIVNLRGRTSPPLVFENIFGNCFLSMPAFSILATESFMTW
ncbi:UNVERIFIED_CONTAM: Stemmadenine O-acetyltransferase [Sesamum latifolium]|uniref:Stemmadenine O-acetyltransferase n=1 Tax=Sesamum latifolium TaxID=2727402 RepID=A0AAW2XTS2_9LAMI